MKKRALLMLTVATIFSSQADAQIHHEDIADTTITTWDAYTVAPIAGNGLTFWWHPVPEVVVNATGSMEVRYGASNAYPANADIGTVIDASGNWKQPPYAALSSGGNGNWTSNATDKYMPFRFQQSSGWHYGWVKMSVGSSASSFTIQEWAYNTKAADPIMAGQTTISGTGIANTNKAEHISIISHNKTILFNNLHANKQYQVAVADMSGKLLTKKHITASQQLDLHHLPNGIYIITLQSDNIATGYKVRL